MPWLPGAEMSKPSGASSPAPSDAGPAIITIPAAPWSRAADALDRKSAWRFSTDRVSSSTSSGK